MPHAPDLTLRLAVFVLVSVVWSATSASATTARLIPLEQRVQGAQDVFVATVVRAESARADTPPRVIFTTYTLQIERGILGSTGAGEAVTIRLWGGTVGNVSRSMAGVWVPSVGQRYVFMLKRGWREQTVNPIIGLDQGLFEIVVDEATGLERILDFGGRTLEFVAPGERSTSNANPVSLSDFESWIHVARASAPVAGSRPGFSGTPPAMLNGFTISERLATSDVPIVRSDFTTGCNVRAGGVIWNQYTHTNAWVTLDVQAMAKWNFYSNMFRTMVNPTDDRYDENGTSETFNAMNTADYMAVFNAGDWIDDTTGALILAIAFRSCVDGYVNETDIVFNGEVQWTLDDEAVFDDNLPANTHPLTQTMVHEFGHAAGLDHEFNKLSVMNYPFKQFRAWGLPFMDDAEGIRTTASTTIQPRTDVGVYLFRSVAFKEWWHAVIPVDVVAGESFRVWNFHVENAGTATVVNPALNWYLTPERRYSSSGWFAPLGQTVFNKTLLRNEYLGSLDTDVTLQVPLFTDGGSYYLSALVVSPTVTAPSQPTFPFAHQAAFSYRKIRVRPAPLYVDAPYLVSGESAQATLGLTGRTDADGLLVFLRSSSPAITVPASIVVPAGVSNATFPITSPPGQAAQDVFITAEVGTMTATGLTHLLASGITITAPAAASRWVVGSTQTIRWNHGLWAGSVVTVALSRDGGATYPEVLGQVTNGATSGELAWTVTGPATGAARVRVSLGTVSIAVAPFTLLQGGNTLVNGDFDSGSFSPWEIDGNDSTPTLSTLAKRSGAYSAHLGTAMGAAPFGDSSFYQTISVPATGGYLFYWWKGATADSLAGDWQDVYVTNTSGGVLATIMHVCATTPGWVRARYNMSAFAGQTVRLKFLVHQNGTGGNTDMYVDDVSLGPAVFGDVDEDGFTDRTVFRPSSGTWFTASSSGGDTATPWGTAGDVDVLGDYDGDKKADIAVWRPSNGQWYIRQSGTGTVRTVAWGMLGDIPLAGDLDGDGRDDLVIFRPGSGRWYTLLSAGGTSTLAWGTGGDYPLLADVDGDGKMDRTVFRPSNGVWYSAWSSGGTSTAAWGTAGDVPLVGDFDGDGISDRTVFRPATGAWYVNRSSGGVAVTSWGVASDTPVSGDMDGDGKSDVTVYRGASGTWYSQRSSGGYMTIAWGTAGDKPSGRRPGS